MGGTTTIFAAVDSIHVEHSQSCEAKKVLTDQHAKLASEWPHGRAAMDGSWLSKDEYIQQGMRMRAYRRRE
eukprot:scaffold100401_cov31-Prasinocladus_malaysianus.AAC.2